MIKRVLRTSSGDKKVDALVEDSINTLITINPAEADVGDSIDAGLLDAKIVTFVFNVVADTEVQITNPLGRIPECIEMVTAPDRRGADWFVDSTCTWDIDTLGMKLALDTSSTALTLKFRIY